MKTLGPYDVDDGRYRIHKHAHQSWRTDCGKRLVGHASTWEAALYLAEHDMRAVQDRIRTLTSRLGFHRTREDNGD
ncbi:hypothetical protein [Prescottella equi]|uniref:hypothetical protein n=1 Tax=Rhodococcus hoagii TaxID=43767 RepID=UPI000D0F1B97|nr:hypothetical protein [Prescottella equi]AVP67330.1 hypothetical protein C7H75_04820 [Prescottella equi]AVP67389.1 hypothetical protein C7H75_05140 [Prescottella equi]